MFSVDLKVNNKILFKDDKLSLDVSIINGLAISRNITLDLSIMINGETSDFPMPPIEKTHILGPEEVKLLHVLTDLPITTDFPNGDYHVIVTAKDEDSKKSIYDSVHFVIETRDVFTYGTKLFKKKRCLDNIFSYGHYWGLSATADGPCKDLTDWRQMVRALKAAWPGQAAFRQWAVDGRTISKHPWAQTENSTSSIVTRGNYGSVRVRISNIPQMTEANKDQYNKSCFFRAVDTPSVSDVASMAGVWHRYLQPDYPNGVWWETWRIETGNKNKIEESHIFDSLPMYPNNVYTGEVVFNMSWQPEEPNNYTGSYVVSVRNENTNEIQSVVVHSPIGVTAVLDGFVNIPWHTGWGYGNDGTNIEVLNLSVNGNIEYTSVQEGKFDLELADTEYLLRVKEFADVCRDEEVLLIIDLWDHWRMVDKGEWPGHPLNPSNNIQGTYELPQSQTAFPFWYELDARPQLAAFQKRHVQTIANILKGNPWVILCTGNEMIDGDYSIRLNWHKRTADWIREVNKSVLITANDLDTSDEVYNYKNIDILSIHACGGIRCAGDGWTGHPDWNHYKSFGKPVLLDNDGLWMCRDSVDNVVDWWNLVKATSGFYGAKGPFINDRDTTGSCLQCDWNLYGVPLLQAMRANY